jgi:hypothetical protein
MAEPFDPNEDIGLQLYDAAEEQPPPTSRRRAWARIVDAPWFVKVLVTVALFGLVAWFIGTRIADGVVESQRPLLSGATDQVKESFKTNFDQGTCELKRELVQQAEALSEVATNRIDEFQQDVYERLGLPSSEKMTTTEVTSKGTTTSTTQPADSTTTTLPC